MWVKLNKKVSGHEEGTVIEVSDSRGKWLRLHGLAGKAESPFPSTNLSEPIPVPLNHSFAPAAAALKAEWVQYAVSQGMDEAEAEEMTKAALIERCG